MPLPLLPMLVYVAGFALPSMFGQWLASRPRGTPDDPKPVPGGARPSERNYVTEERTPIDFDRLSAALSSYGVNERGVKVAVAHVRSIVGDNGYTANNNPVLIKAKHAWKRHWTTIRAEVFHDGKRSWRWVPVCSFPSIEAGVRTWVSRLGDRGIAAMNRGPDNYAVFLYETRTSLREPRAFADTLRRFGA